MSLITWDGSLSVGVHSIDAQHTVLIEILNELHDAMMRGEAKAVTGPLLKRLLAYTREHFSEEEAMMEAAGYVGLEAHRAQHRELTRKVENYIMRFEVGESTVNLHLMNFLRDWLTHHIQKVDRDYAPSMVECNIQ